MSKQVRAPWPPHHPADEREIARLWQEVASLRVENQLLREESRDMARELAAEVLAKDSPPLGSSGG